MFLYREREKLVSTAQLPNQINKCAEGVTFKEGKCNCKGAAGCYLPSTCYVQNNCKCDPTMGPPNSKYKCNQTSDCNNDKVDLGCAGDRVPSCEKIFSGLNLVGKYCTCTSPCNPDCPKGYQCVDKKCVKTPPPVPPTGPHCCAIDDNDSKNM